MPAAKKWEPGLPIYLAGPTAVGKSQLALSLADRLDCEIVSVDSMQVYRGLDIGTAKPSALEQSRTKHHLIDVVDLSETFDAAAFRRHAAQATAAIAGAGRSPLFCGGTGLYFKAWMEGLGTAPPSDPQLNAELAGQPLSVLLAELADRDPVTYSNIDRKNPRRIIRAIEVIRLTGRPFSEQRAPWESQVKTESQSAWFFYLERAPEDLRMRIDARVEQMFQMGWVEETEALRHRGLESNRAAMQAIGYRDILEHLRGECSMQETLDRIKIRTRQFAKRQGTWFRRQSAAQAIPVGSHDSPEVTASLIHKHLEGR